MWVGGGVQGCREVTHLSKSWKTGLARTLRWSDLCLSLSIVLSNNFTWSSDALDQSMVPGLGTR